MHLRRTPWYVTHVSAAIGGHALTMSSVKVKVTNSAFYLLVDLAVTIKTKVSDNAENVDSMYDA